MEEKLLIPQQGLWRFESGEIWRHRELFWLLTWRHISVRYRQMLLGFLWVLLEPLAMLLMMTAVFGMILRLPSDGYPYPVFAYAGLLPWLLFSKSAQDASESLRENIDMISKVYFPRILLPMSALLKHLFDTSISLMLLIALGAAYGFLPNARFFALPFSMITALAISLWLSVMSVRFRDLRHVLMITLQLGMYATPIVYSDSAVPDSILHIYQLNPIYWAVSGFRWAMLGQEMVITASFFVSIVCVALVAITGFLFFTRYERLTVDVR
jgi:lipopolysaccharide transport system permease protein